MTTALQIYPGDVIVLGAAKLRLKQATVGGGSWLRAWQTGKGQAWWTGIMLTGKMRCRA
jgi:hypothetical protein